MRKDGAGLLVLGARKGGDAPGDYVGVAWN